MKHIILPLVCALAAAGASAQNDSLQADTLKALQLKGVTIKGERPAITPADSGLTIDMEALRKKHIAANAHELLKEVPLVSSSDGDALELHGAQATRVMINGKPSNLTAEQIVERLKAMPAERVEKVEILYTPPAKLHVSNASVINIVTKRFGSTDVSGRASVNHRNRHANGFGGSAGAFVSAPKWSLDASLSYFRSQTIYKQALDLRHTLAEATPDAAPGVYDIHMASKIRPKSHNFDYYAELARKFGDKSELTFAYTGSTSPVQHTTRHTRSSMFRNADQTSRTVDHDHDLRADYTAPFGMTAGVSYNYWSTTALQSMKYDGAAAFDYRTRQRIDNYKAYADGSSDLRGGWTLSYGAMFNFTTNENRQNMLSTDAAQNSYRSRAATYETAVDAYAGARRTFAGGALTLDATLTESIYRINHYHENDLMPRLTASWKIAPQHKVQLSYNSYKEYPDYWERQDYTSHRDEYMSNVGNPTLKPAKFESLMLQYTFKGKYIFTARRRNIRNFFVNQSYQKPDELQLIYETRNIKTVRNLYFSVDAPVKFGRVAQSNFTTAVYDQLYKDDDWYSMKYNRTKWVCYLANRTTFYLNKHKTLTASVDGMYSSPSIQGAWNGGGNYRVNGGVKWKLPKINATFTAQCNDIFQSYVPEIRTRIAGQWQNLRQNFYGRTFLTTFTLNFGGYKERDRKQPDLSRYGK